MDALYHSFISIITDTGMEISGQVTSVSNTQLTIKTLVQAFHMDKRTYQKAEQLSFHSIALGRITSFTHLDASYPPKLAHDFPGYEKAIWIIAVETYVGKKIIGQLIQASERFISDGFIPLTFSIAPDPHQLGKVIDVSINVIKSIRKLPYTSQSVHNFEKDRNQILIAALELTIPKVLISLVLTYLFSDIPDEIPKVCFDFLKKSPSLMG